MKEETEQLKSQILALKKEKNAVILRTTTRVRKYKK